MERTVAAMTAAQMAVATTGAVTVVVAMEVAKGAATLAAAPAVVAKATLMAAVATEVVETAAAKAAAVMAVATEAAAMAVAVTEVATAVVMAGSVPAAASVVAAYTTPSHPQTADCDPCSRHSMMIQQMSPQQCRLATRRRTARHASPDLQSDSADPSGCQTRRQLPSM